MYARLPALAVIEFATPLSLFVGVCLENYVLAHWWERTA